MAHAELIFGTVQLGQPYGAANRTGMPSDDAARHLIHKAIDLGVTSFDTARAYGVAEERLGEALEGSRAKLAHVVTKLSPTNGETEQSILASRAALKRDQLETLMLHRAEQIEHPEIWSDLIHRKSAGEVKRLGASVQSPHELGRVLMKSDVAHVQLPCNILDWRWRVPEVQTAISYRDDVTYHVRSAFLQGLLAAGLEANWPEIEGVDPEHIVTGLEKLRLDFGRSSLADLCLAYLRAQDWIDGIVVGMENEDQLVANVQLFATEPLTHKQCTIAEDRLPRLPEQLLNPALWPKS